MFLSSAIQEAVYETAKFERNTDLKKTTNRRSAVIAVSDNKCSSFQMSRLDVCKSIFHFDDHRRP